MNVLIKKLEKLSVRECWSDEDDFNPMEMSGANYDDAYFAGCDDGETILARELLRMIGSGVI